MVINWEFLRFLRKALYIFVVGYLLNEIFKKINGYSIIEGVENDFNMEECIEEVMNGGVDSLTEATVICNKDEEEAVAKLRKEKNEIAATDMTCEEQIRLLNIIKEKGISLREGSESVKVYYEIAKASFLEGLAKGLKL